MPGAETVPAAVIMSCLERGCDLDSGPVCAIDEEGVPRTFENRCMADLAYCRFGTCKFQSAKLKNAVFDFLDFWLQFMQTLKEESADDVCRCFHWLAVKVPYTLSLG